MRLIVFLFLALTASAFLYAEESSPHVRNFDAGDPTRDEWRTLDGDMLDVVWIDDAHGDSLSVPVDFPGAVQVWRGSRTMPRRACRYDPAGEEPAMILETLQYEVYVPPASLPAGIRVQARLLLKNKDGLWFEGLGRRHDDELGWVPATALFPGWNTIRVDLSDNSVDMRPRGHRMRWSRFFLSQVIAVGVALQGDKPFSAPLAIDNITTWTATDKEFPPLRITDFDSGPPEVKRYGLSEMTFSLNRPLFNPFAEKEVSVYAVFTPPSGGAPVRVPGFYYQSYRRERGTDGESFTADRYTPEGPGQFKIRFTPREAGTYRYHLEANYRSPISGIADSVRTADMALVVADRVHPGFVRVSRTDPRFFEFENGDFFFPLGHSFRSPSDKRHYEQILKNHFPGHPLPPDRGLRAYEDILPRMEEAGVNCFEIWMASWWLGIEWTSEWKNYHGLGVYNLEHAWKLDRIVDLAEQHGQYIHLVVDNHGKASQKMDRKGQHDHEWEFSPYNVDNPLDGGFLRLAQDLFRDSRARLHYRDKLRYIAARWGWSTRIYGIELWSELDLVGHIQGRHRSVYGSPAVHDWHREMSGWLRTQDHGNHPITTHYSGDWSVIDRSMIGYPFIDYIVCDAYHAPKKHLVDMLTETESLCYPYNKPFMITEFGGDWNASNLEGLNGDLYAGLWWSWMSQSAGAPLYWWFEYINLEDPARNKESLYPVYTAFRNFIAGEDKRRAKDEPQLTTQWQSRLEGAELDVKTLADGRVFYAWVFEREQMRLLPQQVSERKAYEGVGLVFLNVEEGAYAVEHWNCWTGEVVSREAVRTNAGGELRIALPRFTVQTALKIRRQASGSGDLGISEGSDSSLQESPSRK